MVKLPQATTEPQAALTHLCGLLGAGAFPQKQAPSASLLMNSSVTVN